jgi:transcriptional regulator with XRE-family HTH domain
MADAPHSGLAETLRKTRGLRDRSVRSVADGADISATYLMKLEKGEIASPSPHVLHRLAEVLDLDYLDLMRQAGYVVPETGGRHSGAMAQALSSEELTEDEAHAVAAFLQLYRSGRLR